MGACCLLLRLEGYAECRSDGLLRHHVPGARSLVSRILALIVQADATPKRKQRTATVVGCLVRRRVAQFRGQNAQILLAKQTVIRF
jgi:hypothetical protein